MVGKRSLPARRSVRHDTCDQIPAAALRPPIRDLIRETGTPARYRKASLDQRQSVVKSSPRNVVSLYAAMTVGNCGSRLRGYAGAINESSQFFDSWSCSSVVWTFAEADACRTTRRRARSCERSKARAEFFRFGYLVSLACRLPISSVAATAQTARSRCSSCPRTSPQQLTGDEMRTIKSMVLADSTDATARSPSRAATRQDLRIDEHPAPACEFTNGVGRVRATPKTESRHSCDETKRVRHVDTTLIRLSMEREHTARGDRQLFAQDSRGKSRRNSTPRAQ